jgi:NAD(P)-dependent dehydrogenase (short-subunit alcohol dehydrogenase family)
MTTTAPKANSLRNKVALITGGTSGIGRAAAITLAKAGAAVVIGARREAEGAALVKEIEACDGRAVFLKTDVTDKAQVAALVAKAVDEFGGLDIAFNNAGIEGDGLRPLSAETEDNLRQIMEVNFFGVWNSMKAELPAMTARGGGVIINTTSVAGLKGFGMFSSYAASKFAVEGLSRSIAQEVAGSGIRINTIAPGPIDTPLLDRSTGDDHTMFTQHVPMQRAGTKLPGSYASWLPMKRPMSRDTRCVSMAA